MKELSYLNKYFLKYKTLLGLGVIFVIISVIFQILPAQLVRNALDLVIENINVYNLFNGLDTQQLFDAITNTNILIYGLSILGLAISRGLFLFLVRQTIIVMSRKIEYDLKNEIFDHYQSLPLSFYRMNKTGDLMARISEDVSKVRMYLGPAVMYGLNIFVLMAILIPYMFSVNARLTLFALIPLPILSVSIYFVNNIINKRSEEIQRSLSNLSTYVQEAFSGIRVIKSFAREKDSALKFDEESNDYKDKSLRLTKVQALFMPLILALIGLSTILTVYIGGIEVVRGNLTYGHIAEFIIYVNLLTWPVTSLGWITSIIQRAAASQKRINEFLSQKTEIISGKVVKEKIEGRISFKNVSFIYPDSGTRALQNISFEVNPGESLAIIGTTGSGKSTLANLIARMYDVNEGIIEIDDFDIKCYDTGGLRKNIGYVPQDVFLFSDTIGANIAFSVDYRSDKIREASEIADLHNNIIDFPLKYDTRVGERGITLSGGQKQRVSIARAIIKTPKILILDDSLSAVDTKTENTILKNMRKIMEKSTTIIISHRVSSAKLADKILVLDDGKIVQQGTHEELISGGVYKELYDKQLQSEEVNA